MSESLYFTLCGGMVFFVLLGLLLMTRIRTATAGTLVCAAALTAGVAVNLIYYAIFNDPFLWTGLLIGVVGGVVWCLRIRMPEMPQIVALLNGFGGAASAIVPLSDILDGRNAGLFPRAASGLAMMMGAITLAGSLTAAAKLDKKLPEQPKRFPLHRLWLPLSFLLSLAGVAALLFDRGYDRTLSTLILLSGGFFGMAFILRIGTADMSICIGVLNALSGLGGSLMGMSEGKPFLVAVGGIVMAGGLVLTRRMCKDAGYTLVAVLARRAAARITVTADQTRRPVRGAPFAQTAGTTARLASRLRKARRVAVIPGYGMAASHAGKQVKALYDAMQKRGMEVVFGVHSMAGRLPGHMNVLLVEAGIPYHVLLSPEMINPLLEDVDIAIVVGANDVINPAARDTPSSRIYGKPIIQADRAAHVVICNADTAPGYDGVANPLYTKAEGVTLLLGNAPESVRILTSLL